MNSSSTFLELPALNSISLESTMSSTLEVVGLREYGTVLIIDGVTLAERILESRLAAQMTQQQLADACDISMQAVSHWENGRSLSIAANHLFKLADTLKVDARWLATGEGTREPKPKHGSAILDEIAGLPQDKQALIASLVKSLTG